MFSFSSSRDWGNADARDNRMICEEPVTDDEIEAGNTHGNAHVDAVPGCQWRPGTIN